MPSTKISPSYTISESDNTHSNSEKPFPTVMDNIQRPRTKYQSSQSLIFEPRPFPQLPSLTTVSLRTSSDNIIMASSSIKRDASVSSPDLRPLKRARTEGSLPIRDESSPLPLSDFVLSASTLASSSIKRDASLSSPDLRPLKRARTEGSLPIRDGSSPPPLPDFVLSASTLPLPRNGSFISLFFPPVPPSPRRTHGARLRSITPLPSHMDEASASFDAAIRSRTCTPIPGDFRFAPESARYHMQPQPRAVIDFSLPVDDIDNSTCPLSLASNNILAFPRGNRVYLKNISSSVEDVGYTFKPMKKHGILRLLDFSPEIPNMLALGTSNGNIELWDVEARKMTRSWHAGGLSRFQWNEGRVLAVGDEKGSIQYYDTRIGDRKEMKMKKGKMTRHEAAITTLSWNRRDPRYLASGDRDGVVFFWDSRQDSPLNIGEMVQRRRKMQHDSPVSTMAWYTSRVLVSASNAEDNTSVVRVWTMDKESENIERHEYDASIVGIHSSACRELLLVHGPGKTTSHPSMLATPIISPVSNTISAYAMPYFKEAKSVTMGVAPTKPILSSVLDKSGTRLLLAVGGEENKLKVCDVWGKKVIPSYESLSVHGSLSRQNSLSSLSRRGSLIIR